MKKKIIFFFAFLVFTNHSFSQIDDILKKIPGVGDVLIDEAVTTSIKDAYPSAYWLNALDKKILVQENKKFNLNLDEGYYRFQFNTFCLHAGTYAPTEGAGYLVAPLKGSKADLIKNILGRYSEHPEIDQKDVQLLIWGIEARQKFSNYDPAFQYRVTPLLKPEEIAMMEVDVKDIAYDVLPQEAKDVLNLYSDIRGKLSDANSTYEDVERLAVKTGIPPFGKGSKKIDAGVWTSIGEGVYMRCFPHGYQESDVEIFIPENVSIKKDNTGEITSIDDGLNRIEFEYSSGSSNFTKAIISNLTTNEESTLDNNITDLSSVKTESAELVKLIKKSFGKKKSKRISGESLKTIEQLKSIEWLLTQSSGSQLETGKELSVNALYNYISEIETGTKKGGGKNQKNGLRNVNGLVFAPANIFGQRLGSGGPKGGGGDPDKEKDKDCKVRVYISQVPEFELPKPDWVYTVRVDINIDGSDEKCVAEEIKFNFLEVSKERGRYMNDNEKYDDTEDDLKFSDMMQGFTVNGWTASKPLSGKSQTVEAYILCKDYGAFGKLGATVKVKGTWYTAEADGTPDQFITIPYDMNENKIADAWEKQNSVYGKPAEWDEDPKPTGQASTGDGLTNYEEYRGFMIDDGTGTPEYKRTDPGQKEIFVIDEKQKFDVASWKSASGITAYWLTKNFVFAEKGGGLKDLQYRRVDFCGGYAKGEKYAINLVVVDGINDPNSDCGASGDMGIWGCSWGPPKFAEITVVFPDRIRAMLRDFRDSLAVWKVRYPTGFLLGTLFVSTSMANKFISAMNNSAKFEEMVNYCLNMSIIHEVGHACGIPHHCLKKTKSGECIRTGGDHKCPMSYAENGGFLGQFSRLEGVMKLIDENENLIVVYTGSKFCKTQDNCFSKLQVNDRLNYPKIPLN
jgi:hypothetical protein